VLPPALSRCAANRLNNWLKPIPTGDLNHFYLSLRENKSTKICQMLTKSADDSIISPLRIIGFYQKPPEL
jgi:hypothetical protein